MRFKSLAMHVKDAGAADDATLAAIRQYTLRDFTPDELQIREYVLAHNCIDRDNECFDEPLLDDFASSLPGKGVYIKHPMSWDGDSGPAEGRVFGATTQTLSLQDAQTLLREPSLRLPPDRQMVKLLMAQAYFAKTPENAGLLIKQDAGIAGDVSIGFSAEQPPVPVKDVQGNELTARRWQSPGSALEMSLVWLGAQPGARATKNAPRNPIQTPEPAMALTDEQITELQTKAATGEKSATALGALKTALGDDAALLDNPAQLKQHVSDAKAYKTALMDDIVAMERALKITGDTEDDVKNAKAFLAEMPVERLKTMQKGLEARLPQASQIKGANPNGGAPGGAETPKDSVINNPAIAA